MARPPDPNSKTAQIVIIPINDEENKLFREFKRVLAKDSITVREYFLASIESKVKLDNPQLHFKPLSGELILNKKPPKHANKSVEVKCECGGRENCGKCAGQGTYYEEAA